MQPSHLIILDPSSGSGSLHKQYTMQTHFFHYNAIFILRFFDIGNGSGYNTFIFKCIVLIRYDRKHAFRILFKGYAGHHGNGIKIAIGASFLQGYIDQLNSY